MTSLDPYQLATRGGSDGLWDWNLTTSRVHFAPRWIAMVGCEDHEVGQSPDEWLSRVHPEDLPAVRREIDNSLEQGSEGFVVKHRMRHRDGTDRWMTCHAAIIRDGTGRPTRILGCHADVTSDRLADPVTGLPNRLLFRARVQRAIERACQDPKRNFAVLVVGLERRPDPATASESGPDQVLATAARRVESCLREPAGTPAGDYLVARLAGDHFGILLEGPTGDLGARATALRVLAALQPASPRDVQPAWKTSIGIAACAPGYRHAEEVIRDAHAALHRAKALGDGRCEVFDTTALDSVRVRVELEADLERALDRREFVLHYQPIVALPSNRIVGLESLVRWQHPAKGLLPPAEFLSLAEQSGQVVPLGAWVLREACRQLSEWRRVLALPPDLWVSVNLSGLQFRDVGLFDLVGSAIREARLDPRCLMIEVTESTVMENPAAAKGLIMQFRVMGVKVGLDDFGTGHSALAYLHQFPADFLKVDRSFVRGLEASQDIADIVRTVNSLADRLDLEVIAEGIERQEQLEAVRSLRCGYVQGFLFARPQDRDRTAALLEGGLELASPGGDSPASGGASAPSEAGGPASDTADPPTSDPTAADTPPSSPPVPDTPVAVESPSRTWNWRPLAGAGVAAAILVSIGLVVRGIAGAAAPERPPAVRAQASKPEPPTRIVTSASDAPAPATPALAPTESRAAGAPGTVATSPSGRTERAPAAPLNPARIAGPSARSFAVVHQHAFGSCAGRLVVIRGGLSFVPDSGKDAFALASQEFLVSLRDDGLVVKSASKTYRFRSPAADRAEGSADLARAFDAIRRAR